MSCAGWGAIGGNTRWLRCAPAWQQVSAVIRPHASDIRLQQAARPDALAAQPAQRSPALSATKATVSSTAARRLTPEREQFRLPREKLPRSGERFKAFSTIIDVVPMLLH
jgi:hypothetical protein